MALTVCPCHQLSSLVLLVSVVMLIGTFITTLLKIHSILIYYVDFPRGLREQRYRLPPGLLPLGMSQPEKEQFRVSLEAINGSVWAAPDNQQELFQEAWTMPSSRLCFGSAA